MASLQHHSNDRSRPCLDWTRDPPPQELTPFQKFIRDIDWKCSPLGPMAFWPDQLRQMVLLIVADPVINPVFRPVAALLSWLTFCPGVV